MRRFEEGSRAGILLTGVLLAGVLPLGGPQVGGPLAGGISVLAAQQAGAETRELHPEAEEAISRLKSPWCPGLMLEVCPSYEAAAFRDTLRMMAQDGILADSLVTWALARHGDEWSALPRTSGTDLVAWVVPPLALLFGIGVVILALRHLRRRPDAPRADDDFREISEDEERRIQEALRDLERT